jgi:hypothetical protein
MFSYLILSHPYLSSLSINMILIISIHNHLFLSNMEVWEYHSTAEKHMNMLRYQLIPSMKDFYLLFLSLLYTCHFEYNNSAIYKVDVEITFFVDPNNLKRH